MDSNYNSNSGPNTGPNPNYNGSNANYNTPNGSFSPNVGYNPKPTLAFFGATGGCTLACLAPALQAGYNCIALVRTPAKLTNLLTTRGIPSSTISSHLTIIKGSTTDKEAVHRTLFPENLPPISYIISGVGGTPDFSSPLSPKFIGKTICQDTIANILECLRIMHSPSDPEESKPVLMVISTTGITEKRDIPMLMTPLYKWGLKVPHADKEVMERLIVEEISKGQSERVVRSHVVVRPSWLNDGVSQREKVRVLKGQGEGQNTAVGISCPFVGYTICREDVGGFMFGVVEGLDNEKARGREYLGSFVSISH
ncbi:hypothetical protein BJY04DRAFT_224041 [Aspergillus karnatakaensis]|uniref:uncharacterized protein n=1 Tax=Aspergillus karnatakaensis TaxID=1810916 RepID=UPI003CCD0B8D